MFKSKDKVRFIISDYFNLMKGDFYQPFYWSLPSDDYSHLMIGGEYTIDNIKKKFFFKGYKLENTNIWVSEKELKLLSDSKPCKFKPGMMVNFNPICSHKEIKYLQLVNENLKVGSMYMVEKVINNYYVIIKLNSKKSIPLRWIDFKELD